MESTSSVLSTLSFLTVTKTKPDGRVLDVTPKSDIVVGKYLALTPDERMARALSNHTSVWMGW